MALVLAGMVLVAACFVALAATDRASVRESRPGLRTASVAVWLVVVVVGWAVFAWFAVAAPGGLDGAWHWVRSQSLPMQIAMWALLLPWMLALWISQTEWVEWVRWTLIAVLAALTVIASVSSARRGGARDTEDLGRER